MSYQELPLGDYIARLSTEAATPGGGSAGALCGAQGAALACMVAALTLKKEKYAQEHALCREVQAACEGLRDALLAQIDADCAAYDAVIAAYRLPKEDASSRAAAIQAALRLAAQAPLDTMRLALQAARQTERLLGHANPNCASDLSVAALNLSACCKSAWENVAINLQSLRDAAACEALRAEGTEILREMDILCAHILK